MDESTMQVIIEVLVNAIKELQTQNLLLKYENERLKEKSKNA
ncbi:MAG: hypothetical protein U0M06_07465 [Clostridia bacterium]|nr:hypothetical protein [Clostridia bacterium]